MGWSLLVAKRVVIASTLTRSVSYHRAAGILHVDLPGFRVHPRMASLAAGERASDGGYPVPRHDRIEGIIGGRSSGVTAIQPTDDDVAGR